MFTDGQRVKSNISGLPGTVTLDEDDMFHVTWDDGTSFWGLRFSVASKFLTAVDETVAVSDDRAPMTGTWYQHTTHAWILGKVVRIAADVIEMATSTGDWTGGRARFAADWELS